METYLYSADAALFSPLGLLGLGSPAMLISAMNGHTAVTWHIHAHRQLYLTMEQGTLCIALPSAETNPSTPPIIFPPAFRMFGAWMEPHKKANTLLHLSNLSFTLESHLYFKSKPCTWSNPSTQIQDRLSGELGAVRHGQYMKLLHAVNC